MITIWNGSLLNNIIISQNLFQITVEFTCNLSSRIWYITNVYGPNSDEGKVVFTNWLSNLDISNMENWMILGDFYYIRGPEDRNRPRGDHNSMMLFNSIIQQHDLV